MTIKNGLILGAITAVLSLSVINLKINTQEFKIILDGRGLYPSQIDIPLGSKVTFVNQSSRPIWPASDPHPTHIFLNGFDPQRPIEPRHDWSFVFDKPGSWHYHDHLNVSITAEIDVISQTNNGCLRTDPIEKQRCFENQLIKTVNEKGVDAGLALLADLFEKGEQTNCHWASHIIGKKAAENYLEGVKFTPTRSTAYCAYGFYHAFVEILSKQKNSSKSVLDFCDYIGQALGKNALQNCFHGIGHGYVEDPPPRDLWNKPSEIVESSLQVCQKLFPIESDPEDENRRKICSTGAFTVLAQMAVDNKYGVKIEPDDPFSLCKAEPEEFRSSCLGEFGSKMPSIIGQDISKITPYLQDLDAFDASMVVRMAAAAMMQTEVVKNDQSSYITKCHELPMDHEPSCIAGVAWGLVAHGDPGKEELKAIKFCDLDNERPHEQERCFEEVLRQIEGMYSKNKLRDICIEPATSVQRSVCARMMQNDT